MPARRPVRNPRPLPDELVRCDSYDTKGSRCKGHIASTVWINGRKYKQCLSCAKRNVEKIDRFATGGKIMVKDETIDFTTKPV